MRCATGGGSEARELFCISSGFKMRRALQATDIYTAVWPLNFVSKLFGLAPPSLQPEKCLNKCRTIFICLYRMWTFVLIIALLAWEYICITDIAVEKLKLKDRILQITFSVPVYSCTIITLFLSSTVNRHKVQCILAKLAANDHLLSTMKYGHNIYRRIPLFLIIQFTIFISIFILIASYNIYAARTEQTFIKGNTLFFQLLSVLMNSIVILQFVDFVLLLKKKYKYLNNVLESSTVTSFNATNLHYFNMNHMTTIDVYASGRKPFDSEHRRSNITEKLRQFRNLRIMYTQLYDVACLINSTYGFSLLSAAVWVFVDIITGVALLLQLNADLYNFVLVTVLWTGCCVALMAAITMSCSMAVSECNRSAIIVQKIIVRDDIHYEVVKELEKMLIQFQVMKIRFTACGFFNLDLPFFCGIFGATLSYLVIILQL
jgi:hypothetical protein